MKIEALAQASIPDLVARFAEVGLAQDEALRVSDKRAFRRLFRQMGEIDNELRSRGAEARLALLSLYAHPNPQVRLKAAVRTLGVAPRAAREVLEAIRAERVQPYALDAGMTINFLDDGTFVPT